MIVFDQFIISRRLLYGYAGLKLPPEFVSVFKDESMTTVSGRPREFKKKGEPSSWPTVSSTSATFGQLPCLGV